MSIFRYLTYKDYLCVVLSIGLIFLQVWLDLKMPEYLQVIVTNATMPGGQMSVIWENGAYMLLCAIGSMCVAIIAGFFAARIATGFSQRLRGGVFNKVQSFSNEEINKFSTASLITRSTNDITQVQMAISMGMQVMIKAPILAIWAILKILDKSWMWTTATIITVAIIVVSVLIILLITFPKFRRIQKQTDQVNNVMRESLRGVRVVRAFNAERYQEEKFEKVNNDLTKTNMHVNLAMIFMGPIMMICLSGLSLAIYVIAGYIFNDTDVMLRGQVLGQMMEFSSYAIQVVMAFMLLIVIFVMLPRAITAGIRIKEVLSTKCSIIDGQYDKDTNTKGVIEFKNVTFRYPGAKDSVLENINLTINKGETVAFIGSTGSGKSTLINLVPRFYDVTEGKLLIDGIDAKEYKLSALRDKIGYVSQKAFLFSGTVEKNVAFGEKMGSTVEKTDIDKAIEISQSAEFVNNLDGNLQAKIDQGGANLSGGQKQRLSIARAIARRPEIYIFDDAFSALDYKTDTKLRHELKTAMEDATTLIVAQRIGTIKNADKIVVLEEGKIVGVGTHQELLKTCPIYQEIALSQLSKEELSNA